jgi:hypothetical protein
MVFNLFETSERAELFGVKFKLSIAWFTFRRVLADTDPLPDRTLETVPIPTPANFATSLIVAIIG